MKDGNVTKYESKLLQTLEIFLPTTNCKPSNEGIVNPISPKKPSKYLQQTPKNGFVFIWVFPKILGVYPPNHPLNNRVFHYFHHPFWGVNTPIFGDIHIVILLTLAPLWCSEVCHDTARRGQGHVRKGHLQKMFAKVVAFLGQI